MVSVSRRKKDDNVTMDTICHNPAHRLHGVLLDDYNNSKCEMKERKSQGSQLYMCSCSEDECNDHVFFSGSISHGECVCVCVCGGCGGCGLGKD